MFNLKHKLLILALVGTPLVLGVTLAIYLKSKPIAKHQQHLSNTPQNQVIGERKTYQDQSEAVNGPSLNEQSMSTDDPQTDTFKVIRVIDGDTIEIEGGQKVRYIGIDTPEATTQHECFGTQAASKNRELTEGKDVSLEKDISQTDKYGRLLRYVYIDNLFVNEYLVSEGYAHSSSYPPDIKYQDRLKSAQNQAMSANKGLWNTCQNQNPLATIYNNEGCQIKGNISSSSEKIYHLSGQKYYDKTVIDEGKGERWFCFEEDALSAGWRKSKI